MSDKKPELEEPAELRRKAALYRQAAAASLDQRAIDALLSIATEYEADAERIERARQGSSQTLERLSGTQPF